MFKVTLGLIMVLVPSIACAEWYASVDFMTPTRTVTDENVFQRNEFLTEILDAIGMPTGVFFATVGTERRLGLNFDFVAGGRVTVGHQTEAIGLEGSYLVTDQWNQMAAVSDASGLLASPFTAPGSAPNPLVDSNTFASVAYQTKLESAELNLTFPLSPVQGEGTWKVGVRAVRLDEEFQYFSTNPVMNNTLLSSTDNRIIGPQIAFQGRTGVPGGFLAAGFSGLVGYNDINRVSVFNGVTSSQNTHEASLVGDASIEYQFTPHPNVLVRIGYQVLGIGSVGLAANDPMINNNQTEGVIYQLPYIGIVVAR